MDFEIVITNIAINATELAKLQNVVEIGYTSRPWYRRKEHASHTGTTVALALLKQWSIDKNNGSDKNVESGKKSINQYNRMKKQDKERSRSFSGTASKIARSFGIRSS